MKTKDSPLYVMGATTNTDYWADFTSVDELKYGVEHGHV